jgi:hypothetical protein
MNWIKQVMKGPLKPSIETLTLVIAHKNKKAAAAAALLVHLSVLCMGADHLMPPPLLGFVARDTEREWDVIIVYSPPWGENEYNQVEHTA